MGKMQIRYALSQAGQKASLLAGGDGREVQVVDVPDDLRETALRDPDCTMDADGDALLSLADKTSNGKLCCVRRYPTYSVDKRTRTPVTRHRVGWGGTDQPEYVVYSVGEKAYGRELLFDSPQDAAALLTTNAEAREEAPRQLAEVKAEVERLNSLPETIAAREQAQKWAEEYDREEDEFREKKEAREEEEERAKAAAQAAFRAEAEGWIRGLGSERLHAILDEGLLDGSLALYRAERLVTDRPGWIYDSNWCGGDVEHRDIRNPSMAALEALREAKAAGIEAELKWAHHGDSDDYEYGDQLKYIREPILVATFLGRRIVKRLGKQEGD